MWLALTLALTIASSNASRTLSFDLTEDGAIVVPVWLDGQGPFRFLLDTGASQSVVSEQLAKRLSLVPNSRITTLTPSGERRTLAVGKLSRIDLGAASATDVAVAIVAADSMRLAGRTDGIIGQDVLGPQMYTIDYRRRVIVWLEAGTTPSGTRLLLDERDGRLLVVLPQNETSGRILRLVPDTGSDGLVLFARPGRQLPASTPMEIGVLHTVAGHRLVRRVLLDRFTAGDLRFENLAAVVVPRTDTDSPDGDGLLPLHIFSAVTFSVREKLLVIER